MHEEGSAPGLLIGKNGAGKTTLLNIISSRIFPTSGDVIYKGTTLLQNESKLNEVYSAYPNIKIVITGNDKTYASFTGECEKVAAYNQESMQRTAIGRLEELLDERFIKECFE